MPFALGPILGLGTSVNMSMSEMAALLARLLCKQAHTPRVATRTPTENDNF